MDYSKNPDNYYININKDHHPISSYQSYSDEGDYYIFVSGFEGVPTGWAWYQNSADDVSYEYQNYTQEEGDEVFVYMPIDSNFEVGDPVYSDHDCTIEAGKFIGEYGDGSTVNVINLQNTSDACIVIDDTMEEAPSDDNTYGRKQQQWVEITGGGGSGNVDDVKVNGTSVVVNKIATIPNATTSVYGVVKTDETAISTTSATKTNSPIAMTGKAIEDSLAVKKNTATTSIQSFNATATNGSTSIALGSGTSSTGTYAVAIGKNATTNNQSEIAIGTYNKSTQSSTANVRTQLSVGIGQSASTAKNNIEQKYNGDLYINGLGGFTGANSDPSNTTTDNWLKDTRKAVKPLQDVIARDEQIIEDYTLQDASGSGTTFVGTAGSEANWDANKYYECGTLDGTRTYVFKPKPFDKAIGTKCYVAQFSTGATVPTIVFPTSYQPSTASTATRTLKWQDVEIQPNKTYEISVINGAGIIVEI